MCERERGKEEKREKTSEKMSTCSAAAASLIFRTGIRHQTEIGISMIKQAATDSCWMTGGSWYAYLGE